GDNVQLQDVLDESIERARAIIEEKNPDLPADEKEEIARTVGLGAIKYAELSQHRLTDYVFSWDKMLSLQGNTAPYLMYSYVRIQSIFRKAGQVAFRGVNPELSSPEERALALKLTQFGESLPGTLADHRPNLLANYLFELATTFHSFFEACPVLKSEGRIQHTRLMLCEVTAHVLKTGLSLLGIKVPSRM
ncbi:MAG: arginine--tRNA ligase, partial [Verrucomicrobiota bacterium]